MRDSRLNTLTLPTAGDPNPSILATAGHSPMRVVIMNVGGTLIILSHDATTLTQQPTLAGTAQLLMGADVTIVLAPGQSIFGVSQGGGGQASVAMSDALNPAEWGS